MIEPLWKSLQQLNVELLYDLAITLLDSYPREIKIYAHTKTCTQVFIATSISIAKTENKPNVFQQVNS